MKTVKNTFAENSLVLIISTVLVKIIGAVFKIPLASDTFLGDLGFGYYSVVHDIFTPFYVLAISGLPSAVSHLTAEFVAKNDNNSKIQLLLKTKKLFIILGLIFSVSTLILSIPIITLQKMSINALYGILTIIPSIFLCFVISAYRGYFEGHNNMYPTAFSKIIEAVGKLVLGLILSFIVIKKTNNPAFASAAALLAISIGTLIATFYLKMQYKKDYHRNLIYKIDDTVILNFKSIFALSLPYVLASFSASIVSIIDLFTVKMYIANANDSYLNCINITSVDISTMLYGLRSKAFTLFYLIPTITMSLGISSIPVLTEYRIKNDTISIKSNVNYSLKLISFISFPAAIGLTVLSKPIMQLLYSSNDFYSSTLLFLYGIAALFAGISIPLTSVLQALGLQKRVLVSIIISFVIKITVNLILVPNPSINIFSAPIGTIICYIYLCFDLLLLLKNVVRFDFKTCFIKPILSAVICGIFAFAISSLSQNKIATIFAIFVAIIVYLSMIILLKAFTKDELSTIPFIKKIIK